WHEANANKVPYVLVDDLNYAIAPVPLPQPYQPHATTPTYFPMIGAAGHGVQHDYGQQPQSASVRGAAAFHHQQPRYYGARSGMRASFASSTGGGSGGTVRSAGSGVTIEDESAEAEEDESTDLMDQSEMELRDAMRRQQQGQQHRQQPAVPRLPLHPSDADGL